MKIKKNREDILGYDFPQISLKAHSLEDAINFQDIIPTIIYLNKKDIKIFKEEEKKLIWILEILYHLLMKQIKLQKKFLVLLKKLEKI